jgi:ABC-type dipeptide/oligopeptide/nickel transport system ATPase subunit
VIKNLGHKFKGSADDLIGIQPRLEALESLFKLSSKNGGFQVLGIWGMGGIGKTTLATVLYDRISYQFDACCYIENVRKIYEDGGSIAVQKQILCRTLEEKVLDPHSPSEIARIVRNRLHNIKLLVVLDNVDQIEQINELDIKHVLLHPESRIIIITRDEHILKAYGAETVYEVELMNCNEAHKLLCRKAFISDYSSSKFAELIPEVLKYTQCLPLAIRVIGSFLHSRNTKQWKATLDRLRNSPPDKILKVLQVSYDGLDEEDKEIFLHIACFFKGERKDYVSRILDACGLQPDIGIPLLAEKSLITIINEEIHMHEMLQELGKKIVRGQHPDARILE